MWKKPIVDSTLFLLLFKKNKKYILKNL